MSHVPEVPHPPSSLSFGTVEALESWLQNPEPREPDPRLSIATLVVAPEALKVVLDHARRLPAVRELYIDLPTLAKPERSLSGPEVPPTVSPIQAVVSPEHRSTIPDVHRSGDEAGSLSCDPVDAALLRSFAYDCKQGTDVVSMSPSPDNPAPPSTALNGAVAIMYCSTPFAKANCGENISPPRGGEGSSEGAPPIVLPVLDIVHGDLDDVGTLCEHRKGCIRELVTRLPPRTLAETASRERFKLVLSAMDPAIVEVELQEDNAEYNGLLAVFCTQWGPRDQREQYNGLVPEGQWIP
ncbi:hypothetical protein K466DRAFT_563684 [Polyporus arcularius HHB13444]|uniref:Uncharacterized protein n=1 Tax=Polyporus arcularius HHB13444 TaxID=1314778 RepID=A0A5C3PLL8_9APHY|nr:hypothetical protein K466DRAFT_563684 [Polyporus arcularius HHB13444]